MRFTIESTLTGFIKADSCRRAGLALTLLLSTFAFLIFTGPDANAQSLYVANFPNNIVKVDLVTGAQTPLVTFTNAFGMTNGPQNLYVTDFSPNVYTVNPSTGAKSVLYSGSPLSATIVPAFGPGGNFLYVAQVSNVIKIDTSNGTKTILSPPVGGTNLLSNPRGLTIGPDGNLYLGNEGSGTVLRINTTTGVQTQIAAPGFSSDGLVFDPSGSLYVSSATRILRIDNPTGASPTTTVISPPAATTSIIFFATGITFAPDGNLYVADYSGSQIVRVNPTTGVQTKLSPPVGSTNTLVNPFGITYRTSPTSADSSISGRIAKSDGTPLAGTTLTLSGIGSRRTITDSQGNYRFDNVETGGFYTVAPSRANYTFNPANLSFSLTGNKTDAVFSAAQTTQTANPLDTDLYFVRQHYLDFLSREPDIGGLAYWALQIENCQGDASCILQARISVSAAYFMSEEFQDTGSFVYRLYKGALGRQVNYPEFSQDRQQVIGGSNLDESRAAFADSFIQRPEFVQKYSGAITAESFVDALIQNMQQAGGVDMSMSAAFF